MTLEDLAKETINDLNKQYLSDDRTWILGFSGGKDSTLLLQITYKMLLQSQKSKPVFVISSDTLVEPPIISGYLDETLFVLEEGAKRDCLPLSIVRVQPKIDDTFFVNLIGRGYPSPNRWFRWCTDRLKIDPATNFIHNKINELGEVIILLGNRRSESANRAQSIDAHKIPGTSLSVHTTLPRAYVYAPIMNWTNDQVWDYLLLNNRPWGGDNNELLQLYKGANGGECPLVIDRSTPSCGNSRFGCWVCTVVQNDKSMQGFIDSGYKEFVPLLSVRNWLREIRNDKSKRKQQRRDGKAGLGPFTFNTREEILYRVLKASKISGLTLIQNRELQIIDDIWLEEFGIIGNVQKIVDSIFGCYLSNVDNELTLLNRLCKNFGVEQEIIHQLIGMEKNLIRFKRRHGLINKIDTILTKAIAAKEVCDASE